MLEVGSVIAYFCGISPDLIAFALMNIQIFIGMKGIEHMGINRLGVVLTCVYGVV